MSSHIILAPWILYIASSLIAMTEEWLELGMCNFMCTQAINVPTNFHTKFFFRSRITDMTTGRILWSGIERFRVDKTAGPGYVMILPSKCNYYEYNNSSSDSSVCTLTRPRGEWSVVRISSGARHLRFFSKISRQIFGCTQSSVQWIQSSVTGWGWGGVKRHLWRREWFFYITCNS